MAFIPSLRHYVLLNPTGLIRHAVLAGAAVRVHDPEAITNGAGGIDVLAKQPNGSTLSTFLTIDHRTKNITQCFVQS